MKIFKRDKVIQDILSNLDIPRNNYIPQHEQGIGPYDPDYFVRRFEARQERERNAQSALHKLTDEELLELIETPERLDSFAIEFLLLRPSPWYAGGFAVAGYKPDYRYWVKVDFWTLEEATCLSIGFKPEEIPDYEKSKYLPSKPLKFFRDRMFLINRAFFNTKGEHYGVSPESFCVWAEKKNIEVPDELTEAVNAEHPQQRPKMLNTIDRRPYDSALKVILGLLASQFGYRDGAAELEMKRDITAGLADLGLSLDRKTLAKVLGEAVTAKKKFLSEQQKRDDADG